MLAGLKSLWRTTGGTAGIEFAIAAPVLVAILIPLTDLGMAIYQQMQVKGAAQAGAQYAMAHGWNSNNIQGAVTRATTLPTLTATPAPAKSCGCPNGTAVVAAACGANCTNGQPVGTYVTVGAQATYTPLIPYPVVGSSMTLSAQATARIQ